ncbi:pentatricopeptide repeat-containing protein At2g40240, mitochondrial-like [Gastrolobium bilobum]|uniref:pentatricopeptide repeat-containing protein At2g40240, mitochondrial-like n=1 Tax=Gastrolobium bilobum TaxID=150636 RepID=UPI002AB22FD4|nr:pentatricopeptide repeat-containing protein At2g40240, mitochondrial-like [Gastrolobium bilobum]
MSFLRKPPSKTLNSLSILTFTLRRFATQTAASKPFPDVPTSAYYDEIAADAGSSGNLDALRDILNKRIKDGCFNTKRTFSFITNTNFSPSLVDDLIGTFSRLKQGFTRKNAFESLVTRLCKLHRVDDALRVVESMARGGGCELTASTFHPILNLLTREKSMDQAQRVVDLMARLGVRLDLTAHNMFLMAHCFAGDLAAAAEVLRRMEEEGFEADARTFDALVMGACRTGKVEGAMVMVRRMVDDGVPMVYSTHMHVIVALLKMKCYEQAVKYVRSFSGKDKALDAELFGCLGSKLVNLKSFEKAMLILEEMNQRGLPMGYKLREFYEMNVGNDKCKTSSD